MKIFKVIPGGRSVEGRVNYWEEKHDSLFPGHKLSADDRQDIIDVAKTPLTGELVELVNPKTNRRVGVSIPQHRRPPFMDDAKE